MNLFIASFVIVFILSPLSFSMDNHLSQQMNIEQKCDRKELTPSLYAYDQLPREIWLKIFFSLLAETRCYVKLSFLSHYMNWLAKELFRDTTFFLVISDNTAGEKDWQIGQQEHGWRFPNVRIEMREDFRKLGSFLRPILLNNPTLTSLTLTKNRIGKEGAQALADALQHNTTLTSLSLIENKIGKEGKQILITTFQTNTTLTSLKLLRNKIVNENELDPNWNNLNECVRQRNFNAFVYNQYHYY